MTNACELRVVETAADLAAAIKLFRAYAASLDIDLSYQDFEAELAVMPGRSPAGVLMLARARGPRLGCVGVRSIEPGVSAR